MCPDWLKFQRSSCQKVQSTLNCYVLGMIPRRSFIKFVNLVLIKIPKWLPLRAKINIEPYRNMKNDEFSETTKWNKLCKVSRNRHQIPSSELHIIAYWLLLAKMFTSY